ncbi:MAG: hypothetical protein JJ975_08380 [Bacteroidia bacterium]|nr:hypothetical protein [Bacteroidia bacterium]
MKRIYLALLVFSFGVCDAVGQPYVTGGKTRHRFAQLNVGVGIQSGFGGSSTYTATGIRQTETLGSPVRPRIMIGGSHFWGHADFYVAFPLTRPRHRVHNQTFTYSTGVETAFKYYPWRIESEKIRPYLGLSLISREFSQVNHELKFPNGPTYMKAILPALGGLTYNRKNHLVELGVLWDHQNKFLYRFPDSEAIIESPPLFVNISYRYMLETTLSAEKNWLSGRTARVTEALAAKGELSNYFLAVGMSSAWWTGSSSYNTRFRPYVPNQSISVMPEFALGYYVHKGDFNLVVNYRSYRRVMPAFRYHQEVKRQAVGIEFIKHIGDYHGFVPFIGPVLTRERFQFSELDLDLSETYTVNQTNWSYGINFGWDIRPNRLQWFILRTNVRYFPALMIDTRENTNVSLKAFEFNFIQLVLFPDRIF